MCIFSIYTEIDVYGQCTNEINEIILRATHDLKLEIFTTGLKEILRYLNRVFNMLDYVQLSNQVAKNKNQCALVSLVYLSINQFGRFSINYFCSLCNLWLLLLLKICQSNRLWAQDTKRTITQRTRIMWKKSFIFL